MLPTVWHGNGRLPSLLLPSLLLPSLLLPSLLLPCQLNMARLLLPSLLLPPLLLPDPSTSRPCLPWRACIPWRTYSPPRWPPRRLEPAIERQRAIALKGTLLNLFLCNLLNDPADDDLVPEYFVWSAPLGAAPFVLFFTSRPAMRRSRMRSMVRPGQALLLSHASGQTPSLWSKSGYLSSTPRASVRSPGTHSMRGALTAAL